jgi:hypothetical protein
MTGDALRKDDIRWAQVELRDKRLYKGSLDGILGPETKRALGQFQKNNGLGRTASLDAQTWGALTGDPGIGQGSSIWPLLSAPEEAIWADKAPQKNHPHGALRSAARRNKTLPNWGRPVSGAVRLPSAASPAAAPVRQSCRSRSCAAWALPALLNQSTCSMPLSTEIAPVTFIYGMNRPW